MNKYFVIWYKKSVNDTLGETIHLSRSQYNFDGFKRWMHGFIEYCIVVNNKGKIIEDEYRPWNINKKFKEVYADEFK